MKYIQNFDSFLTESGYVALGFGLPSTTGTIRNLGGSGPTTGYDLTPITAIVEKLCEDINEQGCLYEDDDDENHSYTEYILEVKKKLNKALDDLLLSKKNVSENTQSIKVKPGFYPHNLTKGDIIKHTKTNRQYEVVSSGLLDLYAKNLPDGNQIKITMKTFDQFEPVLVKNLK